MNSEAEKWLKDVKMNFDPKAKLEHCQLDRCSQ